MTILVAALMLSGVFFLIVSSIGLIRLPDFYARNHAVGKSETLGAILVIGALAVYNGLAVSSLKLLIVVFFVLLVNPTATHAISRAAFRTGLKPWTRKREQCSESSKSSERRPIPPSRRPKVSRGRRSLSANRPARA